MFKPDTIHGLILLAVSFFPAAIMAESIALEIDYTAQQASIYDKQNIILSGALTLSSQTASGEPLMEFSGIAWDQDDSILYALSDRGYFISLRPVFKQNKLKRLLDYN